MVPVKTTLEFRGFPVDSGTIGVFHGEWLRSLGYAEEGSLDTSSLHWSQKFERGDYVVNIEIKDSPRGKLSLEVVLKDVEEIVIGDLCYGFNGSGENWKRLCKATAVLTNIPEHRGKNLVTGGDGAYSFRVTIGIR